LALDGGEWSASCPSCFNPGKKASTYWIRSWVGPQASLDMVARRKIPAPARYWTLVILPVALSLYGLNCFRCGSEAKLKAKLGRFENTFLEETEVHTWFVMLQNETCFMPLSRKEFLKLAYDFPEEMHLSHRYNDESKSAW